MIGALSGLNAAATPELQAQLRSRLAEGMASGPSTTGEAVAVPGNTGSISPTADGSFSNVLGSLVRDVAERQSIASDAVSGLLEGRNVNLHQAVIAMEEASVSFQLMVEVRNKLLESYQEIMRMQV